MFPASSAAKDAVCGERNGAHLCPRQRRQPFSGASDDRPRYAGRFGILLRQSVFPLRGSADHNHLFGARLRGKPCPIGNDRRFLHALLRSFTQKFELFTAIHSESETVEEKVLFYLSQMCPNQEFKGVETAAFQLGCSRRQLQRVLQDLCAQQKIKKLGKGWYRLEPKS